MRHGKQPDRKPEGKKGDKFFDEDNATGKSGRLGAQEPPYGERDVPPEYHSKRPNPQGPEYEEGGAYPGRSYEQSPESMRAPDRLAKPETHHPGKQQRQERTVGNHPADPNRIGAKWNLLPPGISDEDVKNPGGMKDKRK